jgi:hypothetical protein
MIRVVVQDSPSLFALALFPGDASTLQPTFEREGATYYRAEVHNHYVLYKRAISGWGTATGPRLPDARQV